MSKLKEKREERSGLFKKMEDLFDSVDKDGKDFTDEQRSDYNGWDDQIGKLDEEIATLEKMEARKKEIALNQSEKEKEKRDVSGDEKGDKGKSQKIEFTNESRDKKKVEKRNAKIFSMIQGHVTRNSEQEKEARQALVDAGHYDDLAKEAEKRGGFSTLTDGKGGVLIPTVVSTEIIDIAQQYGVIPQYSLNLGNILQDDVKVPQVLGRPAFTAVNQKSAITASGFNLGGLNLKARKWGCIIDWTTEVEESIGAILMPIIMEKLGEAFALIQDDVFFNGNGSSTYNGIKGLEGLTGTVSHVRTATADSGNTAFSSLDAGDFLKPQKNVTPGARMGGRYVMHPNQIFSLMEMQDGQGQYIYGKPSELMPVGSLWGFPISTSEIFPYTDGTSKTAAAFFNPRHVAFATGRALTFKLLDQGSITDEDDNTVNLATMDAMALRVTGLFDLVLSSVTRSTAGTAEGAFSVLRTAAS